MCANHKLHQSILLFILATYFVGCATFHLPVSNDSTGDWQRPLDLKLSEKKYEPNETNKKNDKNDVESLKMPKNRQGSLQGLKIFVDCVSWEKKSAGFATYNSDFCPSIKRNLKNHGAQLMSSKIKIQASPTAEDNPNGSLTSQYPDILIRYIPISQKTEGCGFYGFISYMTFWLIPCKGLQFEEARIEFLDRDGNILNQYPITFRRRTLFGWVTLLYIHRALVNETEYDESMISYVTNLTYTLAAQKRMVGVNL